MTDNGKPTTAQCVNNDTDPIKDNTKPDQSATPNPEGKTLVTIKFRNAGKQYDFDMGKFNLNLGDEVVVETNKGRALGTVAKAPRFVEKLQLPGDLKPILRIATEADLNMARISASKENEAHDYCVGRITHRKMEMKLVKAEYLFDGSKIIFYFTADGRVDFRELVKDLAQHFHTRIEMRQIGVRDEAKLLGGIGICGRELCCGTFLTDFNPVSVRMAKQQGLALNPTKISGQCGRLLCCLSYEYDTYCKMAKKLPKQGSKFTLDGKTAEVLSSQTLAQTVTVRCEGSVVNNIPIAQLKAGKLKQLKPDNKPFDNTEQTTTAESESKGGSSTEQKSNRRGSSTPSSKGKKNDQRHTRNRKTSDGTGSKEPNVGTVKNKPKSPTADESPQEGAKKRSRNNRRPQRHKKPGHNKQGNGSPNTGKQQNKPSTEGHKPLRGADTPESGRQQTTAKQAANSNKNNPNTEKGKNIASKTEQDSSNKPSKRRNRNRRRPARKPSQEQQ